MNVFKSAITGGYEPKGDINNGDCIIGPSFGTGKGEKNPGYVNQLLANRVVKISKYVLEKTNINLPLLLQ
jgi:hypothetical protein